MTTNRIQKDQAGGCPYAGNAPCVTDGCMMWRWMPLTVHEPGYKEAVAAAIGTTPDGHKKPLTDKTAPRWVNDNLSELGLVSEPYRGWCGLAGEPKV